MTFPPLPTSPAAMNTRVADILTKMEQEQKEARDRAQTERSKLAIEMQAAGVNHVTIDFSGGGDSGQVNEVEITMADGFTEPTGLKQRLEAFAYKMLEGIGVDWYNNEGGQGEFLFDLTKVPPSFSGNVDVNYTESKTEWSAQDELA